MPLLSTRGSGALSSSGFSFGENIGVPYWYGGASLSSSTNTASVDFFGTVCIDSSENIYAFGGYQNNPPTTAIPNPLIMKINKSGVVQWQKNFDASGATGNVNNCITTDVNGNVYVGGSYLAADSTYNALIAKYNTSGTFQWIRALSGATNESTTSIYTDSSANVYAAGFISGGNFIVKYSTTGTLQWQRIFNSVVINSLVVDASGNIYVCGTTSSTFYVAKLDSTPAILWQKTFAVEGGLSSGNSIYVDASGNIYVSGTMPVSSGGARVNYIAKLDNNGGILWQSTFTTALFVTDQCITRDSFGSLYVSCNNRISKFTDSGDFLWQRSLARANFITSTSSGDLILTGSSTVGGGGAGYVYKLPGNGPSLLGSYSQTTVAGGNNISFTYTAESSTALPGVATSANASLTLSTSTLTASTPAVTTSTPTIPFYLDNIN